MASSTIIRILEGIFFLKADMINEENAVTHVNAMPMTMEVDILTVTARAEQIPST